MHEAECFTKGVNQKNIQKVAHITSGVIDFYVLFKCMGIHWEQFHVTQAITRKYRHATKYLIGRS